MKLRVKKDLIVPVLYSLPLNDGGFCIQEHQILMQELIKMNPLYDHLGTRYPNGDYLVIFYDEFSSPNPKVVKAFLGFWEYIGYTFETAQQFCYKFTPHFEVDVFPQESDLKELFQDFKPMFYRNKNQNILMENSTEVGDLDKNTGSAQ